MAVFKNILKKHLAKTIVRQELEQWFDPLVMDVDEDKRIMRVSFPHSFFGQWFMEAKRELFELQVFSLIQGLRIVYEDAFTSNKKTNGAAAPERRRQAFPATSGMTSPLSHHNLENTAQRRALSGTAFHPLLERYQFDTFITNRKNDFPLAVAHKAVENALFSAFTPFVIYGKSGSGKTHLLGAMANSLIGIRPEVPLYYGSVDYLNGMLHSSPCAVPVKELVVFIDDIQKIYHSPALQEVLASLIDTFHASRRLLALCSDAHPSGSPRLSGKLLARLTAGLVVELKKPDLDVRRQYLQQRNTRECLGLSQEHILSMAQRHQDIRGIDGLLTRISAYKSLMNHANSDMNKVVEHSLRDNPNRHAPTPESIIKTVAKQFSVNAEDITGKKRNQFLALARPVAMLLCRELLGLPLAQVGKIFGNRDHSSILYSLRKINKIQESDKDANMRITALKHLCLTGRE